MPTLNNPFMSGDEVIASASRGNTIAAAIRNSTYPTRRPTVAFANRGYSVDKWDLDAIPAINGYRLEFVLINSDADAEAAIAKISAAIKDFRQRYPNAAEWDTYGV